MKLSLSEIRSNAMEFAAEWRDAASERADVFHSGVMLGEYKSRGEGAFDRHAEDDSGGVKR